MSSPASPTDLTALGWSGDEVAAQGWLDAAWLILMARIPDIQDRLDAETLDESLVIFIQCQMALRVLRNLSGRKQESVTIDDATRAWTLDERVSSGYLTLEGDELALLSGRAPGKVFSILPS